MTPALLTLYREEYRKRLHSGLAWTRMPNEDGCYYHINFDAKEFLSRFSEEDAAAISAGVEPLKYKQDKRFARVRRLMADLSKEDRQEVIAELLNEMQETI